MKASHLTIAAVAVITALATAACGGADDTTSTADPIVTESARDETAVDVPEGATLCGVYTDEYQVLLDSPTPFGEDGWEDEAQELLRLAAVLEQLAPDEQAANAEANVGYFQALADVESASEFIEGSNAFNLFLIETCLL
jgi:hypothetical protein